MAGLNIFVEFHPVGCHPVERFPRIKPIRLNLLAHSGLQVVLLVVAVVFPVPEVGCGLKPQVGDVVAPARAQRKEMVDFAGRVILGINIYRA
jgi:hypothetical protein